jgi:drug/metabolite transporter (DMT)-like permease
MALTVAHWASMPSINNKSNRPVIGISAVVCGLFLFSLQDVVIKFFSNDYSVLQIVVIRGVVATSIIAVAVAVLLGPTCPKPPVGHVCLPPRASTPPD